MAAQPPSQLRNRVLTVVMRCFCQKLGSVMFTSFEGKHVARSLIGFGTGSLGPKASAEGFGRDAVCKLKPGISCPHSNIINAIMFQVSCIVFSTKFFLYLTLICSMWVLYSAGSVVFPSRWLSILVPGLCLTKAGCLWDGNCGTRRYVRARGELRQLTWR